MESSSLTPVILTALAVALAAALLAAMYLWRRVNRLERLNASQRIEMQDQFERSVRQATNAEREQASVALQQAEQRFSQALEDQKQSALSVVVHPFVKTEGQKGVFTRETKVEIGYKYQLFVQGLPCFEPHTMILESTTHKEVDQRMLELLKTKAEQAAEAAVLVKGGGAAKMAITVAKTVMKLVR